MGRQPCCEKEGVKKGPWSAEEDRKLVSFISSHGHGCWREVPKRAGLERCGKSCRLRWINYLRPDLKRGVLSPEEENLIIHLHALHGNKWSRIAAQLPGRTDNEIKNCWNTRIKKKLQEMGIDPVTHKPIPKVIISTSLQTQGFSTPLPAAVANYGFIQRSAGVNGSPSLGHPPFLPTDNPLNTNAYMAYNMQNMANKSHESFHVDASPRSAMSSQVTSSLSHTKCEDEHSNFSADSDHSSSNVHPNVHALASNEGFTGNPHTIFTCKLNDKDGLQHVPHMLPACPDHELHIHPHMHNPPQHLLHNTPHVRTHPQIMSIPLHMLQNSIHIQDPSRSLPHLFQTTPIHPLQLSELEASQMVPTVRHFNQTRGLQASSPSSENCEDMIGEQSGGNMAINDEDVKLEEGDENNIKAEDESMSATTTMSSSRIKYVKEGAGLEQALQCEQQRVEEEGGNRVQGSQYWSSMMSEAFFSVPMEAAEEPQGMSSLIHEASCQHHNIGFACNSFLNAGPWGNMDSILTDPMVTKYSFY